LSLARVLESLAKMFPSFDGEIRKWQYYVRKQLTSPKARRAEILAKIVDSDLIDLDALVEATRYDKPVVRADIRVLMRGKRVTELNREGRSPRRTAEGRAVDHIFYSAVPSRTSARRG